jgi:hypothetical protein
VPDRRSTATWVAIGLAVALLVGMLGVIGFRIVRADRTGSGGKSTAPANWAGAPAWNQEEIARRELEDQLLQARMDAVRVAELDAVRAQEEMKAAFEREDFRRREELLRRDFDLAKGPVAPPRGLVAVPNPECTPLEPEDLPRSKASGRVLGKAVKQVRDAKVVEIDVNGSLGTCWDAEGKTFYCLGGDDIVHRIALDGLKELRTLKLDSRSRGLALSSEGLVVSVGCPGGALWVIDTDSLEVKRRIALPRSSEERQGPAVDWMVSSPNQSIALADGHHLLAVDLKKGVVTHEYKENGKLAHLYFGAMSPDGKYLFREENGELQRIRINRTNLAVEDSSGKIAPRGNAINVSPDGQWVCLTCLEENSIAASATNIYLVENLRQPFCTIPPCDTPRSVGFDPKTGRIYSGNSKCPLQVFDQKGNLVEEYNFAKDYGESLAIVVHPAGNRILLETGKKLFLVELDAGREP